MGPPLNGPFREVVGLELEYHYNDITWAIVWDQNKAIDVGEWSICGGGWLERFYNMYIVPIYREIVCLLLLYVLATSTVISG